MLPSGSGDHLCDPLTALLWRWLIAVFVYWGFSTRSLVLCPSPFLWGWFSMPPAPSTVCVWVQFSICFSVLQGSLVLNAALWLWMSALWSTIFRGGLSLCLFTESTVLNLAHCPAPFLSWRFSIPPTPTAHVLLQFAVCFSVLWGSSVLDAALWLRRWSLWSTTFPALGSGLLPTCFQSSQPFLCLFTESVVLSLAPCLFPFLQCSFSVPSLHSSC
jgi:hypothetical protein